jgi:hypothetical protein
MVKDEEIVSVSVPVPVPVPVPDIVTCYNLLCVILLILLPMFCISAHPSLP